MNLSLVKKNVAYAQLLTDVMRGRQSHAYLVLSEDEELRRTFFLGACTLLICGPNGEDSVDYDNILQGNYVEVINIDASVGIKTKDIELLTERIMVRPVVGDKKIIVIDNADKLSAIVQTKLLKVYEEPPNYVTFLMGTNRESAILPTIRSRGKKLYLNDLSTDEIYQELISEGYDSEMADVASAVSMGNYGKALRFCSDDKYRAVFESAFDTMMNLKKSSQIPEFAYKKEFGKDDISITLDFMEIILSDVMKEVTNSSAPKFVKSREFDVKTIAKGYSPDSVSVAITLINEARKKLTANINPSNVAVSLLFGILEAQYKWQKR